MGICGSANKNNKKQLSMKGAVKYQDDNGDDPRNEFDDNCQIKNSVVKSDQEIPTNELQIQLPRKSSFSDKNQQNSTKQKTNSMNSKNNSDQKNSSKMPKYSLEKPIF